ncbi:MAG TPA: ABC transporter permease [Phycisphaerales bacterium]|nr:ABC transporter permease [Phycisphaerales bacterium]
MSAAPALPSGLNVAMVIARRDLTRFLRQPARIAAAIGTPLLLWVFLGSGFAGSFRPAGLGEVSYSAFMLPGAITLTAVFAAIFSSISIIEDRNEGWLQAALVSPAPRWSIALGKILGSSLLSFVQSAVMLLALPLLHLEVTASAVLLSLLALALTAFAMTAMGFVFAWHSETTASFHAVMNIVFMPMWLLSGAFFPPTANAGGARILTYLMRINPLTWCTQAIREPILGHDARLWLGLAAAFALAMFVAALLTVSRNQARRV